MQKKLSLKTLVLESGYYSGNQYLFNYLINAGEFRVFGAKNLLEDLQKNEKDLQNLFLGMVQ